MTNLHDLLAAATDTDFEMMTQRAESRRELRDIMEKAAPLVLEYMKGGHHACTLKCTCGYSELARALGVGE